MHKKVGIVINIIGNSRRKLLSKQSAISEHYNPLCKKELSKYNRLQERYQELSNEISLKEYRQKQQQHFFLRRESIRKLIQAGKLMEEAGVIEVLLNLPRELAVEKLKLFMEK